MRSFRLNRQSSHPDALPHPPLTPSNRGREDGPGATDALCVFIRRMASAFKQFQTIFPISKAEILRLSRPSGASFRIGRGKGGLLRLAPAPLLEEQAFQNVRSVVVPQPL